jgi:hypothetical protein
MYSPVSQLFAHNISSARRLSRGRVAVLLVTLAVLALTPTTRALLPPPPPDGGYGNFNTAEGDGALFNLTSGLGNAAVGFNALNHTLNGTGNTGVGIRALFSNTDGNNNTALGSNALEQNTTGHENTACGSSALGDNTTGIFNTASGVQALNSNTNGHDNTATGFEALFFNTTGHDNTANGSQALFNNVSGDFNTATGVNALFSNTGNSNTADGVDALQDNTTGFQNVASGAVALFSNTTGHDNTTSGFQALLNNTTGSSNIALGARAGSNLTTGNNNIDIGATGVAAEANTIRIGKSGTQQKTFIAGVSGKIVANGVGVIINSNGQLGTVVSSARFKEAVKPMDKSSEALLKLKPVTFRYKEEVDSDKIPQFGLIAEEVEKINPDLVVRDEEGKVMSVRYEAVNAMLLNEFLKEHRKVQNLEKQVAALTAGLQKVTARVETANSLPRVVSDN